MKLPLAWPPPPSAKRAGRLQCGANCADHGFGLLERNAVPAVHPHLGGAGVEVGEVGALLAHIFGQRRIAGDKGIQRIGKPIDAIERSMESVAQLEMYNLERNLSVLSVISRAAPIFGFIGTLAGLMQLFFDINTTGEFVLNTIAGGLYVKLVTSISGLLIGLISFLGHSYLHTQIDKTANKMEAAAADFLDILQEPTK